ncbi:MAG TPA: hypothetical protein V6C97_00100 [Oculatellaceae cyanobacterium]
MLCLGLDQKDEDDEPDYDDHANNPDQQPHSSSSSDAPSDVNQRVSKLEAELSKFTNAFLRWTEDRHEDRPKTSLLSILDKAAGTSTITKPDQYSDGWAAQLSDAEDDEKDDSKNAKKGPSTKTEVLGPGIVKEIKAHYHSLFAWANSLVWKGFRNKREGITLAFALDLALQEGVSPTRPFMEVLLRRVCQLADQTNSWVTATELESVPMSDTPLIPQKVLQAARNSAQTKMKIRKAKDDGSGAN